VSLIVGGAGLPLPHILFISSQVARRAKSKIGSIATRISALDSKRSTSTTKRSSEIEP
jgi:hypothetical protein